MTLFLLAFTLLLIFEFKILGRISSLNQYLKKIEKQIQTIEKKISSSKTESNPPGPIPDVTTSQDKIVPMSHQFEPITLKPPASIIETTIHKTVEEIKEETLESLLEIDTVKESIIKEEALIPEPAISTQSETVQEIITPIAGISHDESTTNKKTAQSEPLTSHPPIERTKPAIQDPPQKEEPSIINEWIMKGFKWLFTGNIVAKVAVIILFFGISYLLKYSIEQSLLSPAMRIAMSAALGCGFISLGWFLRKRNELFSLIMQGASIGIFYFTIFASFKLYGFIPQIAAFGLLILLCGTSIVFAIAQRALSLAIIACVGGYLAPILLSNGSGNHIALFSYYLLISCAILIISFWQSWRVLNYIGFAFTLVVAHIWGYRSFIPEYYLECQIFILANMIIYGILSVLLSIRDDHKLPYQNSLDLTMLFSVPAIAFHMQSQIVQNTWEYALAFSALGFGLFYLIGTMIALRIWHRLVKEIAYYGVFIGLTFCTIAVPLALNETWTASIWLIEGTVLTYFALKNNRQKLSWIGLLILFFSIFETLLAIVDIYNAHEFISLVGILSIIMLINASLWYYHKDREVYNLTLAAVFLMAAFISWCLWIPVGTLRVFGYIDDLPEAIILLSFVASGWLWYAVGKKIQWPLMTYFMACVWIIMPIFLVFINNDVINGYVTNSYLFSILSYLIAFTSAYYMLFKGWSTLDSVTLKKLHVGLFWIIAFWLYLMAISFISRDYFVIKWSVTVLIASMIIISFFFASKHTMIAKRIEENSELYHFYWNIVLFPIVAYILIHLIYGLFLSGRIAGWRYIPFLNPLDISAGFGLVSIGLWSLRLDIVKGNALRYKQIFIALTAICFLWGNSMILRTVSAWSNIAWNSWTLWHSSTVQAALSLVWTVSALILIIIATRYHNRKIWFVGASLLGLVVFKLIFVDSVQITGIAKAFVFISIAIFMLVIGYFSPLPPKEKKEIKHDITE